MYERIDDENWCKDNEPIPDILNDCNDDYSCFENAREKCDGDFKCFGVAWYKVATGGYKLKKCLSRETEPKTDGWRTVMKSSKGKSVTKSTKRYPK